MFLNSLNVDIAKIFHLHFIMDKTFKEISKELKLDESTIKSNLYRTLRKIREHFLRDEVTEK